MMDKQLIFSEIESIIFDIETSIKSLAIQENTLLKIIIQEHLPNLQK